MNQETEKEILRTLIRQNEQMERMTASFEAVTQRLDTMADYKIDIEKLKKRMYEAEQKMHAEELVSVKFRTTLVTYGKLIWLIGGAATASIVSQIIRATMTG